MNDSFEPFLIVRTPEGESRLQLVGKSCWTIGRSRKNDIRIDGGWVSRNHAMVQRMDNGKFFLIDLGSRNGSFVNGVRVGVPATLRDGDRVGLGEAEIQFNDPAQRDESGVLESEAMLSRTSAMRARKLMTVVVCDIRDFTPLTRKIGEEMLSELIGAWFHKAGATVEACGGFVDKYIGDAFMAIWFHGEAGEVAEEMDRILHAIDAIQQTARLINTQFDLPQPFRIGVGINTGNAIVANTGTAQRPDYTSLGDTVNQAFRLESATKELKADVAIGETTHKHIVDLCGIETPFLSHMITLKGYDQATRVYCGTFDHLKSLLQMSERSADPNDTVGPHPAIPG